MDPDRTPCHRFRAPRRHPEGTLPTLRGSCPNCVAALLHNVGMYDDSRPEPIKLTVLRLQEMCPASDGPGTALPSANLDRWIAVADACASWHNGMEFDEIARDQFAVFDPVKRDICASLLRSYTNLMRDYRERVVSLERDWVSVPHPDPDSNAAVSAAYQWTLEGEAGPELIKIRTGRYGSRPEEVAVLVSGKDPEDSVVEVMLQPGTVEALEMPPEEQASTLRRIFDFWDETRSNSWQPATRFPNFACYTMCDRPARCGQYPTDGRAIGRYTRTIRLSKTSVLDLSVCHRKVAWKAIHQIPTDEGDEYDEARERGRDFHELYAAALTATDPTSAFKELLQGIPDDRRKSLGDLWDRHLAVESKHELPISYRETEYAVGLTVETNGLGLRGDKVVRDRPVAVVYIARTDAVGRESDGTPAVVEVRTGAAVREPSRPELDIYALGTARLVKSDRVAIHLHRLSLPEGPECHREVYDADQLHGAAERLEEPASLAASWDPLDALQPSFTVGSWCSDCTYQSRCENYRADGADPPAF